MKHFPLGFFVRFSLISLFALILWCVGGGLSGMYNPSIVQIFPERPLSFDLFDWRNQCGALSNALTASVYVLLGRVVLKALFLVPYIPKNTPEKTIRDWDSKYKGFIVVLILLLVGIWFLMRSVENTTIFALLIIAFFFATFAFGDGLNEGISSITGVFMISVPVYYTAHPVYAVVFLLVGRLLFVWSQDFTAYLFSLKKKKQIEIL